MIVVYDAANSIEAYMIKNMLAQYEIAAYIQGEHLQGGVGDLPLGGLVKVSVDDDNYQEAKKIINEWESTETSANKNKFNDRNLNKQHSKLSSLVLVLGGFFLGAVLMRFYLQSPVSYDGIDLNGDKINDISWTYKNNIAYKTESDLNFDGKPDEITMYENGLMSTGSEDADFDGVFETEYEYKNERVISEKTDFNKDGRFDYLLEFDKENPFDSKVTFFNLETNTIKKVKHYKEGRLVSAELDTNNDGKLDVVISYNPYEEEVSRKPLSNTTSP